MTFSFLAEMRLSILLVCPGISCKMKVRERKAGSIDFRNRLVSIGYRVYVRLFFG